MEIASGIEHSWRVSHGGRMEVDIKAVVLGLVVVACVGTPLSGYYPVAGKDKRLRQVFKYPESPRLGVTPFKAHAKGQEHTTRLQYTIGSKPA
jgi:hypothetical protein